MRHNLDMRSGFLQNEYVMISMSCQGLNPNISTVLAASRLYAMTNAIQVVYQMEEESKKEALMRTPVARSVRSEKKQ
jgi:hypothetical protein